MSGAGHIRRRGERSWEIKFSLGRDPASGERRTRYELVKGTRRDAQARLTELMSEAGRGTLADPSRETLSEFLARWDDWASANVSLKTNERYRQLVAHQVVPRLGVMPVQRLRPIHLTLLYSELLKSGGVAGDRLAPRTVGHVHRLLRRALGHAVQWGVISQNPAAAVSPPKVDPDEVEIVSEVEVRAVLDSQRGRPLHTIAVLALGSGMRRGELCALRWKDIDLDAGSVRVERSLEQTKGQLRFKAPKTRYSRRSIAIPPAVVSELRAYWSAQQEQRLALGRGRGSPEDLVFADWDGSPRKPGWLTNEWLRASSAVGRRINLHALRHTHVSNLIAAGIDILTIARRLGHSNPAVTLSVYGHLYGNTDEKAADAVEAMFARVRAE